MQGRSALEKDLAQAKKAHAALVDAITRGVPAEQVMDRMAELDGQRKALEAELRCTDRPKPLRFHPAMAAYRERVAGVIKSLADAEAMETAKETLRGLIEKIVLTPDPAGTGLMIDLHGALASLLRLAVGLPVGLGQAQEFQMQKAPCGAGHGNNSVQSGRLDLQDIDNMGALVLVAGAGFAHCFTSHRLGIRK